ncbi:MAG: PHP domain-containing protein [Clostridia bacterium]|nr:PHP domain-containing protein [Clostridia bacterium]
MIKRIDLHTHSSCSDGTLTPKELARHARDAGLAAIALTDHDSMAGMREFLAECERLGIEGIPGVEISVRYKRELHIVGLYAEGDELREALFCLANSRGERNLKMLKKMRDYGFDVTEHDLISQSDGAVISGVGRLHIANALVGKGYAKDKDEAFSKYLAKGAKFYEKRFSLSPEERISLIKRSGGIAIWAHPAYAADTAAEMSELAARLKSAGLDGMECLYSRYSSEQTELCFRVAGETGILPSGGSDFHGANKPDVRLGVVSGGGYVPYEYLENLRKTRS